MFKRFALNQAVPPIHVVCRDIPVTHMEEYTKLVMQRYGIGMISLAIPEAHGDRGEWRQKFRIIREMAELSGTTGKVEVGIASVKHSQDLEVWAKDLEFDFLSTKKFSPSLLECVTDEQHIIGGFSTVEEGLSAAGKVDVLKLYPATAMSPESLGRNLLSFIPTETDVIVSGGVTKEVMKRFSHLHIQGYAVGQSFLPKSFENTSRVIEEMDLIWRGFSCEISSMRSCVKGD